MFLISFMAFLQGPRGYIPHNCIRKSGNLVTWLNKDLLEGDMSRNASTYI